MLQWIVCFRIPLSMPRGSPFFRPVKLPDRNTEVEVTRIATERRIYKLMGKFKCSCHLELPVLSGLR
jgi:hypothetical protein